MTEIKIESNDAVDFIEEQVEATEFHTEALHWVNGMDEKSDIGYLTELDENIIKENIKPEDAINYLIGSLQLNDPDLFSQAFEPNVFSDSLINHPNPDKYEALIDIMDGISRKNSLETIDVRISEVAFGSKKSEEATLVFHFQDGKKADVDVTFTFLEYNHGNALKGIIFISTPPNQIIEQINANLL